MEKRQTCINEPVFFYVPSIEGRIIKTNIKKLVSLKNNN